MTWTLTHNGKQVGQWTDEYVNKVANQVADDVPELTYEFLPDPIRNKLQ